MSQGTTGGGLFPEKVVLGEGSDAQVEVKERCTAGRRREEEGDEETITTLTPQYVKWDQTLKEMMSVKVEMNAAKRGERRRIGSTQTNNPFDLFSECLPHCPDKPVFFRLLTCIASGATLLILPRGSASKSP
jgi:hypothetical protein